MASLEVPVPVSIDTDELASYDPLLQKLLRRRGISSKADAEFFLQPDYELHTHDPYLLSDMERAVERIKVAVTNDEHVVIWSDYDTDGIPGAVILHDFFKKIGFNNFENYIPHRTLEGFGLNLAGIEELGERHAKLVITIDCGITDHVPVNRANELGIDVIVTDHHLPQNVGLPSAYAVINPKRDGCAYPEKMLCGAGVVYKLVQGLVKSNAWEITPGWEKWLLDMAGIATLSDMVPLRGENRVFARYGLTVLRKSHRPGLQTLLRRLRIEQSSLTEDDIGFMIAPRINAASRMGIPLDAFRLLATDDGSEAEVLAKHLDKINDERKGHVAAMVKEAHHRLDAMESMKPVIVIGSIDWRPSLLGLVANALMEKYKRPAFVWGRADGPSIKGSCRSDGTVNVVTLMQHAGTLKEKMFIDAGGHAASGGFSIETEMLHHLDDTLNSAHTALQLADHEIVSEEPDADLFLSDINERTCRLLDQLAPFGEGNPKPVFVFRGTKVGSVRQFGKENTHLELVLEDGRVEKKAIVFFAGRQSFTREPVSGMTADILGTIERSSFGNRKEVRLRLIDIL